MNKQDRLIGQLIQKHIFKLPDGRDLFEGSCEELERLLEGEEAACMYGLYVQDELMEKYEDIVEALEAAQFATEETGIVHVVKPIN